MVSPILLVLALVLLVLFLVVSLLHWVWNTTLVNAVNWARPISHWDAFKLVLLIAMLTSGSFIRIGH